MKTIEVVAAVIRKGNTCLATQRGYGEFEGLWEFPGGKIEQGETHKVALKREIQEELGIDITIGELLCTTEYDYPSFHLRMHCYLCSLATDNIELREHKSARWLTAETLDTVKWLPADKEVIDKMKEIMDNRRYTPEMITELGENEIFVFGSNLAGAHGGGAARVAYNKFGAVWGEGVGLQGQSYAIPTMHGGIKEIKPYVDEFIGFASNHPEYTFLVTKIGCGIAGFAIEEIAPLFAESVKLQNVVLPREFAEILFPMKK